MTSLFGIIRQNHALCWKEIIADETCWVNSRIGSENFHRAYQLYHAADVDDFYTMVAAMHTRSKDMPMKLYHEWIALYMHSEMLTDEEMRYRQNLARRMNEKERQKATGGTYPL